MVRWRYLVVQGRQDLAQLAAQSWSGKNVKDFGHKAELRLLELGYRNVAVRNGEANFSAKAILIVPIRGAQLCLLASGHPDTFASIWAVTQYRPPRADASLADLQIGGFQGYRRLLPWIEPMS